MRKLFSLIALLLLMVVASAKEVTTSQAMQLAKQLFVGKKVMSASSALQLKHTWYDEDNKATMYLFSPESNIGFVIIAADDSVRPIVGFSWDSPCRVDNMPRNMQRHLGILSKEIGIVRTQNVQPVVKPQSSQWSGATILASYGTVVKKLETAKWDQDDPYNRLCPKINGVTSLTGCVATAAAIVARFHKWPDHGVGTTPSYTYKDDYGASHTIPSNQLGKTYDYSNMPLKYTTFNTTQANQVANLMYDMGTVAQCMYHPNGTGAYTEVLLEGLQTYMRFSKKSLLIPRDSYSLSAWNKRMIEEIDGDRPIIYGGYSEGSGGHQFVVDGYTTENYFSLNWGWSGYNDGYFLLSNLNPGSYKFNEYQDAIVNLVPDYDGSTTYEDYLYMYRYQGSGLNLRGITTLETQITSHKVFSVTLGAVANGGTTRFEGQMAIATCDKDMNVKEIVCDPDTFQLGMNDGTYFEFDCNISGQIGAGYRLCGVYKGKYSDDWKVIYGGDDTQSEIVLKEEADEISPENIAKRTSLVVSKKENKVSLQCQYAASFEVSGAAGVVLTYNAAENEVYEFPLSKLKSGADYTLTVKVENQKYSIKVKR